MYKKIKRPEKEESEQLKRKLKSNQKAIKKHPSKYKKIKKYQSPLKMLEGAIQ